MFSIERTASGAKGTYLADYYPHVAARPNKAAIANAHSIVVAAWYLLSHRPHI